MIDYKDIGTRIRAARLHRKMTQEQLAAQLQTRGCDVTHISHIETGNSIPSLQVFVDILNALDCSADQILCLELEQARPQFDAWIRDVFADCTDKERKLIVDIILSLKSSMRRLKIEGTDE